MSNETSTRIGTGLLTGGLVGSISLLIYTLNFPIRAAKILRANNQQQVQMQQSVRRDVQTAIDLQNTSHDVFTNTQWRQHQLKKISADQIT